MSVPHFFFHERMLAYDFGPRHPLQQGRLLRAMEVLKHWTDLECIDPGPGQEQDVLRVHDPKYVRFVEGLPTGDEDRLWEYGFGGGDTPPFPGVYRASLDYTAGAVEAARAVNWGAPLAFSLAGGLHHARRAQASGFCVFNDCAVACSVLRERFERVAYVDIDLHHGDGVQWIFYEDPTVLTYSIHESGRSLYPGTGFVEETGAGFTKVNLPMAAGTTGEVWLDAVTQTLPLALERFGAQAVVLQMGCDAHTADPLGHLQVSVQDWLGAVELVKGTRLPTVALGGGGYDQRNVPRMWAAAVATLSGVTVPDHLPDGWTNPWGGREVLDPQMHCPRRHGAEEALRAVAGVRKNLEQLQPGGG